MNASHYGLIGAGVFLLVCTIGELLSEDKPLSLERGHEAVVRLQTEPLPQPLYAIARHGSLVGKPAGENSRWRRWEVVMRDLNTVRFSSRPLDVIGAEPLRVEKVWRGKRAEAMLECIEREARRYEHEDYYLAWPGPNSNTFIDVILRACDIDATLPATAVGKDYRGVFGVSVTSGGTGVQLETPLAGLKIGLTEGVEVHVIGLTIGVDLLPVALIVPFGTGRFGFDDW